MRFKRLDMNLLPALDVLLRLRNVSKAADEMCITQSAMSNALGRLRTFFDDPLLIQVGRRMELSPFAQTLQGPLRDVMMRVESTVITSPHFDPATSTREFSIVLSDYSLAGLGGPLMQHLAAEAPGLRVNLRPQVAAPERLLQSGEIDLMVVPEYLATAPQPQELLFEDALCVIVCAAGAHRDGLDADTFRRAQHVVMEPFSGQESYAWRAMRQAGIDAAKAVSTYAFGSIPDLVRGSDRIGVIQERLARRAVATGRFHSFALPIPLPPLRQSLQWHEHRSRDPGLVWMRAALRTVANPEAETAALI